MSAKTLELVFIGSAVLGTSLLLLSNVAGGHHVRLRVPVRLPHLRPRPAHSDDATAVPILLGSVAMFGVGGLFGVAFQLAAVAQVLLAVGFGAFGAAVAFGIFAALRRAEGGEPTALRDLVGRRGRVTVTIPSGARGTIALTYDGALQTLSATAAQPIARGSAVEVVGVEGMAVTVRSLPPP